MNTELIDLCEDGNVDLVRRMIENGVDLNVIDDDGWTPLFSTSCNCHLEIV